MFITWAVLFILYAAIPNFTWSGLNNSADGHQSCGVASIIGTDHRKFPRLDIVNNPQLFYLRLHGRNSQGWRSGNMQKQFDYNYSETELKAPADTISDTISDTLGSAADTGAVFFYRPYARLSHTHIYFPDRWKMNGGQSH